MSGFGILKVNSVIVKVNSGNLQQTFTVVRLLTLRLFRISSHSVEVSLYLITCKLHHPVAPFAARTHGFETFLFQYHAYFDGT